MPDQNYMSHSAEDCFGNRSDQKSIKDGLGGPLVSRVEAVKQYDKSENKWNKKLKVLKNQNKIIYRISKKSGSHRELEQIKKIKAKASKKLYGSSINSSSVESYSDSSLSSDSN